MSIRRCLPPCMAALALLACSSQSRPPKTVKNTTTTQQSKDVAAQQGEIIGEVERIPADPEKRRIVIWGKVHRIMEAKHGELPEAKPVSTGGVGDPVATIENSTPFPLTLWFSGKCAHHTEVPPREKVTAAFCPGTYHIAAVVDNKDYLPLVRENQKFEGGVAYVLQVVVKQRPE